VGKHWTAWFMECHLEVNARWRRGLDRVRVAAGNPESVPVHFEEVSAIYRESGGGVGQWI
jgi:hypothetical protein